MRRLSELLNAIAWVSTALVGAMVVAAMLASSDGTLFGLEFAGDRCAYLAATGRPCGSCGLTRGWIAMAHAHVARASSLNPSAPFTFAAAVLLLLGTCVVVVLSRRGVISAFAARLVRVALFALLLASFGRVVARNVELRGVQWTQRSGASMTVRPS